MLRLGALIARCGMALAFLGVVGCSNSGSATSSAAGAGGGVVIRITGSDTMVNLNQAWAENYRKARPDVSIQVAGGGSGVGIAGLIDGILAIAAASRAIEPKELERVAKRGGADPHEFSVGLDALAVFVHEQNPLESLSIEELAEVYGEGGLILTWSQLGVRNPACTSDEIIRVSRQNNSGTFVYFREAVLGHSRELKLGSIDQSGSKDVVALVTRTPCAIGYSGMAYGAPGARALKLARKKGQAAVAPSVESARDKSYPIARPLFLYTSGAPTGPVKEFIDWTLGPAGQKIVQEIGYVPVRPTTS
ncbi:MAG: PstS family phosphate ABC transporter substrate-binding protein [Acidobacteriota bacterium]